MSSVDFLARMLRVSSVDFLARMLSVNYHSLKKCHQHILTCTSLHP